MKTKTAKALTFLQALKLDSGKRFYVATRYLYSVDKHHFKARLSEVGTPNALETAVKHFKAQHSAAFDGDGIPELCEAVCHVSRYGSVTYGCFSRVEVAL